MLIAGSIFALRYSTEGSTAAWAFGLLAAAIALASWANVYHYTDEVSDLVDARRADYARELKRLKALLQAPEISEHEAAIAQVASIRAEAVSRGLAAQKAVEAAGAQLLNDQADVAGHGWSDRGERSSDEQERPESELQSRLRLPRIDLSVAYEPVAELVVGADGDGRRSRERPALDHPGGMTPTAGDPLELPGMAKLAAFAALFAAGILLGAGLGVGGAQLVTTETTTTTIPETTTAPGTTVVTDRPADDHATRACPVHHLELELGDDTETWVWVVLGILAVAVIGSRSRS